MSICEHPTENYSKVHGNYNYCPECRGHVCLRCKVKDEISWSSGVCDGCYRVREQERRQQQATWTAEARRQERERIWAEGWSHYRKHFSPNDPEFGINPYAVLEATK